MRNTPIFIRQGDICLQLVNDERIPQGMALIQNSRTLALGEATGHHHSFAPQTQVLLYRDSKSGKEPEYVQVLDRKGAELVHQEHNAITVPQGTYKVIREQEYNPFLRQLQRTVD